MSSVMEKKFIDVLNCDDNVVTISSLNGKGYTCLLYTLTLPTTERV